MAVIGIDLGTTNSTAVVFRNGKVELIPNAFGEYLTPSVVSQEGKEIIVGKLAKERLVHFAKDTASLFKREMGNRTTIRLGKRKYLPEELSAIVVKQLIHDAEVYLQEKVEEIVISVPAYFNAKQRMATKKVGALLGVKVERLINEPSAAAIACREEEEDETFIVFDFGGGTLDVSVVDCFANVINICAIAGNNQLGGSDFDRAIANVFIQQTKLPFKNIDDLAGVHKNSLLQEAERVKLALQAHNEVLMHLNMHKLSYELKFTKDMLDACSVKIFDEIKRVIASAVKDSGFHAKEITGLILVGGSSYMPVVQEYLQDLLAVPIIGQVDMDLLVAKGLGTYIAIKQRKSEVASLVVTDVCPFSLSTAIQSDLPNGATLANVVIERNTVLPTSKSVNLVPAKLGQSNIDIEVYQGESFYAKQNLLLGHTNVKIPVNYELKEPFELRYSYDLNSMLFVEIHIQSTNEHYTFQVGEGDKLEMVKESQTLRQIKDISLKITQDPKRELLKERVLRLSEQANKHDRETLAEYWLNAERQLQDNNQSLRRQQEIIAKIQAVLDAYEARNGNENLDIFASSDSGEYLS